VNEASRLRRSQLGEARADPLVEGERLLLEAIARTARALVCARETDGYVAIDPERELGSQPVGRPLVEVAEQLEGVTARIALVCKRGIAVAVADDDGAALESGARSAKKSSSSQRGSR
jgi:hypothetical protein